MAGPAGLSVPEGLGLPALSPTKDQEIQRYLEALDLVDPRRCAWRSSPVCDRIDDIRIKLDSRLMSGQEHRGRREDAGRVQPDRSRRALVRLIVASQQKRLRRA
jgi:hypothetical protein